jgi:hypothetical protein
MDALIFRLMTQDIKCTYLEDSNYYPKTEILIGSENKKKIAVPEIFKLIIGGYSTTKQTSPRIVRDGRLGRLPAARLSVLASAPAASTAGCRTSGEQRGGRRQGYATLPLSPIFLPLISRALGLRLLGAPGPPGW